MLRVCTASLFSIQTALAQKMDIQPTRRGIGIFNYSHHWKYLLNESGFPSCNSTLCSLLFPLLCRVNQFLYHVSDMIFNSSPSFFPSAETADLFHCGLKNTQAVLTKPVA